MATTISQEIALFIGGNVTKEEFIEHMLQFWETIPQEASTYHRLDMLLYWLMRRNVINIKLFTEPRKENESI
jgi:hypothetical protein